MTATVGLGLLVGLVLGSLGGGGGIITVPVLIYLLGMAPLAATTASLVIVGLSSLLSAVAHTRAGNVRWGRAVTFGLLGTAGTWVGAHLAGRVDPDRLLLGFGVLLLTVAVVMLRKSLADTPAQAEAGDAPGDRSGTRRVVAPHGVGWRLVAAATGVGLLTGFFGVGGGFVVVPALTLLLGFEMPVAIGTSLVVIAVNSATALASRLGGGTSVDWATVWLFTAGAAVGGLAGAALSTRLPARTLTRAFAVLLVLVALYTLARSGAAIAG